MRKGQIIESAIFGDKAADDKTKEETIR